MNDIKEKVYNFKTKYEQGFLKEEIKEILKGYPGIDIPRFNDALDHITCTIIGGKTIIYHCDVLNAINCGIEKRGLNDLEWD